MSFRRLGSRVRNFTERRTERQRQLLRRQSRHNLVQRLEDRTLLAGPELIAIRPDAGALLQSGDTLNVPPREFNLLFKGGADIDEATVTSESIRLVRSGGDGTFGDGNEVDVALGYVGLDNPGGTDPADLQHIVFRTASTASHNANNAAVAFPDDTYRIEIVGSGDAPLLNRAGEAFNDGVDESLDFRLDRGAQVVAIVPQPISPDRLTQSSDEIIVYFDDQELDPAQANDPAFYRLVDTNATATAGDDITILPQSVSYDADTNQAVLSFANDLPEGTFRLDIGRSGGPDGTIEGALNLGTLSDANAFQGNGFLGDDAGLSDNDADVDLFRLTAQAGVNLQVSMQGTGDDLALRGRLLDGAGMELISVLGSAGLPTLFNFVIPADGDYLIEVSSSNAMTGAYRIEATVVGSPIGNDDDNSTFGTATPLGTLGETAVRLTRTISPQENVLIPPRVGSEDDPGHRQLEREAHISQIGTVPITPKAIEAVQYYFPDTLGTDTSGFDFVNLITEAEKQIVREIFELYARESGFEFIETAATDPGSDGIMIGKGDFRAVSPTTPPDITEGLGLLNEYAIASGIDFNDSNRFFGDEFTQVMFQEIGHALGLGNSYNHPSLQGEGVPNDVLPGDHDIVHLQRVAPPNATDIDMYRFDVVEDGRLNVETVAERLPTPSLLDSALKLYRLNDAGGFDLVAQNDDYFGADASISVTLSPGTYYIGVSSTGNTEYDPNVPDSGFGGTSDGIYELDVTFDAANAGELLDVDGTAFDGDNDDTPGGVHSFYFQSASEETTVYVQKRTNTTIGPEGSGTLADPFDTLDFALEQAGNRLVVPLTASIADGEQFIVDDGLNLETFTFGPGGIDLSAATSPEDVATTIETAISDAITAGDLRSGVGVSVSGRIVQLTGIDNLDITGSQTLLDTPNVVRVLADAGSDGNFATLDDNAPYLIGLDTLGRPLEDGAEFLVPQGVNVMVEAGTLFKMRSANLDAGSSSANISRSQSSIQVLGTPLQSVFFRSYHNDAVGGDSDGVGPAVGSGDFGGIVFRDDSDMEDAGVFLNYVNHADIQNGGGEVFVDASELVFAPIDIQDSRPTVSFNLISQSDSASIAASRDSFDDSEGRIGPDVFGNFLDSNRINGLVVRSVNPLQPTDNKLLVRARFDDTDIPHVFVDNLIINGAAGGPFFDGTTLSARQAARLVVDPGVVLKFNDTVIEAELGAGSLIAEGTLNRPVIFTSVADDQFGGSGTFDTDQGGATSPLPGDWGGIYFGPGTSGSIDNALISFAGGSVPIDGISANFNTIEVHQADFRLSRSVLENNADGEDGTTRNGRGANDTSTVYVRGAQPVIVDNVFTDNEGAAISINANALRHEVQADPGRSTGLVSRYSGLADNHGPLIRLNRLDNNGVNGLWVRGEELTTKSLWDDTDIVHVLNGEVIIGNHHAFSGLTLQSSNSESLIIKATGTGEITATGTPVEIDDRIGGTLHILGTVGKPVVLTSLSDDSVGAGYTPDGEVVFNTNNSGTPTSGSPGQWRGLLLDEFSNDRNVEIIRESENPLTFGADINFTPAISQQLGTLAADQKSGDENSRLGFEVQGFISPTDPDDVDVYSFTGTAGTEVWIDIDQTDTTLDSVIEIINAAGTVVARSVRSQSDHPGNLNAPSLAQSDLLGGDHYTQNFRDAGLRYTLPGTAGIEGIYFIRVRSLSDSGNVESLAGSSTGKYHLQVRLQQVQEFPGSTVRFSDIRFAQTGIDVRGLPSRSPIVGEAAELTGNSFAGAQTLVNLLETDAAALGIGGELGSETDIDWYRFDLTQTGIEIIPGLNDSPGTIGVVFDIDYADKADSGDTTIAVYDESGTLIFIGRESNVLSDQPSAPDGSVDDLSRGSLGGKDPYIGPIHLTPGIDPNNPTFFYVAVMSDRQVPTPILGAFQSNATGGLTRLEPVTSVKRIIEDHIGFQGYSSNGFTVAPENTDGLFDISTGAEVGVNVEPFTLQDVALFIATDEPENDNNFGDDDFLYTADPFESRRWLTRQPNNLTDGVNDVQDIAIRSDGRFYGYQRVNDNDGAVVGQLVEIDPDSGAVTVVGTDNINGITPTPNSGDFPQAVDNFFNRTSRADQFTNSDEVDALAFRRIAPNVRGTTPTYDIYYSVRESGDASKLYRATEDGDASLRNVGGRGNFGVVGDIQPAGVTYETQTWTVLQPVQNNPPNITNIRIKSKIAGAAGGFTLVINRPNNTIAEVTGVNFLTNEIFINIGQTQNGAASAQAIVDALNSDDDSRQLVTAVVFDGNSNQAGDGANGTVSVGFFLTGFVPGTDGPTGPLQGRVTGLTFSNFFGTGNLFGVTDAGEFLEINPFTAEVINVVDAGNTIGVPGLAFEGLTLGPQNVENGIYQNTLFAVTETGQVVAFDTFGNGVQAFDGGDGAQVVSTLSGATDGFFTLTTDAGAFGRFTTDPLAVDAPASVSLNEIQTVQTIGAGTGGTFTLSVVDNVGAISSPRAVINTGDSSFDVQDAGDFPATPFVIQVEDEQMLVNVVTGNRFDVTRGHNGTAIVAHPDTSTVFEVKTTSLATNLTAPVLTFSNGDLIEGDTLLTVTDASALPAFPFTIRMGDEEMNVTNVVGNDLTVTRGANGTVIEFHPAGSDVTVVTASLQVVDGLPLPSAPGFNIRINGEDLRVTSVAGTTLGVIRGANGTTIGSHFVGSTVTEIQTTTPLAFDASNAQVEAALEALPAIGINNVQVLNGPLDGQAIGTPIAVEFLGDLAARDIEMLSSDSTRLIGNEVQELSLDPRVVGGTFALEFGGDVTGTLDWDVSAADLQAALRALPSVGPRGVVVSGTNLAAGALQIEFTGPLSDMNVADITVDSENLLQNEQQTITISGGPTSGDFVLDLVDPANTINGTSQPIAYNADATAVRNALELGIPELAGNILVTETAPLPGGVITIEFINGLEGLDIQQFAPTSNFMGGSAPTVIVDTVQTIDADQPIVTETIVGTPVDADVITVVDGVLSVRDALIALPNFDPVDIVAAGILPLPDAGVAVTIGGQYAGTTVNLFDVDNFLNDFASLAFVTQDPGGAGSSIMGVSGLNDSGAQAIGLVFSPLDFNLWHPTTLRSTDEGHGINDPADGSRDPSLIPAEYATPESFRRFNQEDGGVSYQFGLEPWVPPAAQTVDAEMYLRYLGGVNAQFGILNTDIHADLSSNPNIVGDFGNGLQGSYNLPGGALGTLTTRTFDLSGTVAADRPTLYFNYFLDTENHPGSLTNTDGGDPFRDSARVFVSADGGNTWILAASNNSALSQPSPALQPRAELPGFLSHLSDAGLNSPDPRGEAAQMVQELFDNTGQWRQARVDLSIFAGLENLQLRIDFSTAGSMNDPTLLGIDGESTVGDAAAFGEFAANGGRERTIRSNNNQFEGFFVDDFIIGYAERGEMVTGAPVDTSISDLQASVRTDDPQRRNGVAFPDLLTGPYQLEVRRTDEYLQRSGNVTLVGAIFDTNDDHTLNASETSFLSFETGSFIPGLGQWSVTSTNPNRGEFNIESGPTNPFNPFSIFQATPADLGGVDEEQGLIRFSFATDAAADTGLRFFIDGVPQRVVDNLNELPLGDPQLAAGRLNHRTVEFPFSSGATTFTWVFDDFTGNGGIAFVDDIQLIQGATGLAADQNRNRPQGMLMLHSNFITDSSVRGINVQPGATESGGSNPHPGSTINFPQVQQADQRYVPGVVIENNVIAGSSGIRFAGETNANPQRPLPFGRIVNNTLVGTGAGIGIDVVGRASPTIVNNLFTEFTTGINDGGIGTVIRSNFFQDAGGGVTGTDAIVAATGSPLFVDAARGNYYLQSGSLAIDSSLDIVQDRSEFVNFKTELGLGESPIVAPDRDVFGQLRIFSGDSPGGTNSQIRKDRGAIDRADDDAPYATLLNPIDNDTAGEDRDPTVTFVSVTNPLLENFTILLGDGRGPNAPFEGTGVDGLTVDDPANPNIVMQAVVVRQNGELLTQGVDYNVAYNELTGVLRLTPLSTLWEADSVYVVSLDNGLIADRAGNLLRSNQENGDTEFTIIIPDVGTDFGDAPDSYRTLLASNGARHTGADEALPKLGAIFDTEFDGIPSIGADGDDLDGDGQNDEDGLVVGAFSGTATTEGLFLAAGAANPTTDPGDVIAFLNPSDASGSVLPVTVRGDGILDAWFDFNRDGDFDDLNEYAITNVSVVDGVNQIRIMTPATASPGLTYARFRLSTDGISSPSGIAIGGEVEDYRVNILDVAEATLGEDAYTVSEDNTLDVDGVMLDSLLANDTLPSEEFIQPQVVIEGTPITGMPDTYRTMNGTVRVDDPVLGLFTYTPDLDFEGTDTFRYAVSTQRNEGPAFEANATFTTVTIDVIPFNAPPTFDVPVETDIFEDDPSTWLVPDYFDNVAGGDPAFGTDEDSQTVTFTITEISSVPADLMVADPDVSNPDAIEFFPATDAAGVAVYVITGTDDGTPAESVDRTVTVNVRPINDPPRFDPSVTGSADAASVDEAWEVAELVDPVSMLDVDGTITYTLREDVSLQTADGEPGYFIPFEQATGSGYNPIGLLDVFTVGPANEADPLVEGGGQTLSMGNVPTTTTLGGTLTLGMSNGQMGVFYRPPQDYNSLIGGPDTFEYSVVDDGESYINGALVSDPQSSTNIVEFVLNPVNDRPGFEFNLPPLDPNDPSGPRQPLEAVEDGGLTTIDSFAVQIAAGPLATAFDEVDAINGQRISFAVGLVGGSQSDLTELFSTPPEISPEGLLTFEPATDVFGVFNFAVIAQDTGAVDPNRGDVRTSITQTFTIEVLPVNDPPRVRPDALPLNFVIQEDGSINIFNIGDLGTNTPGLLDAFAVGPDNEGEDRTPGGNQTISLREPTPTQTQFGGSVEEILDNGQIIGLRYQPRENFVGTDSFVYTVTDDGITVDFGTGGVERPDPRIAFNTVSIEVQPVNNPPQYSGPANVTVSEDIGVTSVPNWATNVLAGPPTASDELATQDVFFTLTQVSGDSTLFTSSPVAVIDEQTGTASLDFETAPDANGVAVFEVTLTDVPTDDSDPITTTARTFTLTIDPVNDIPTFTPTLSEITVNEDSGPYPPPMTDPWAINISPGPADESDQSVRFEVAVPAGDEALFQQLPTVDDAGILRFLPATNANGTVDLTITAIDSAEAAAAPVVLRLIITPENDTPIAIADNFGNPGDLIESVDEDTILTISIDDILVNDIDPDINNPDDVLSVELPASGFSLNGALVTYDEATGIITYNPTISVTLQSLSGVEQVTDSFTYRAVDSTGARSNIVTVGLNVAGINDAPVAVDDNPTLNPDGPTTIEILNNDSDVDGDLVPSSIEVTLQPAFGAVEIDDEGVVTYTAFQSFPTVDVFRYRLRDDTGQFSNEALVTISANAAPIARDDQAGTFIGEPVTVNVAGNDEDPDRDPGAPNNGVDLTSIQIVSEPVGGDVVPLADGQIRYIPDPGFVGIDTFQYTIADLDGRVSSPGSVDVRVVSSRLQNPDLRFDVNDDGNISPIDALLVINHIARSGEPSIPVTNDDIGPNFYDVNGDQLISPIDALGVITELGRIVGSGEGEGLRDAFVNDPVPMDFLDSIAGDDDDDDEVRIEALDIAFGDLL